MRHLGRFVLDYRLFAKALGLPELARVKVIDDASRYYGGAVIVIEHPDLPGVEEGGQILEIVPVFEDGKLVDWGLPLWEGNPEVNRGPLLGPCALMGGS